MKKLLNKSGQIAVILIFFIAVLLAVFAVILNISKISQNRTQAAIATDSAAAYTASLMAGYAESWFQSVITGGDKREGRLTRSEPGGSLWYVLDIILVIVGIVITVCTCGVSSPLGIALISIGGLNLVLSVGVFIAQTTYIQPETAAMWNKMFKNLTVAEQYREGGLQQLFSFSVQDPVLVDDTGDVDMDGYNKKDNDEATKNEKVGRFSLLYTRRAEWLANSILDKLAVPKNFAKILAKLLYNQPRLIPQHLTQGFPPSPTPYYFFSWDPDWDVATGFGATSNDPTDFAAFGLVDRDKDGQHPNGTYFANEANSACKPGMPAPISNFCHDNFPLSNPIPWKWIYDPMWENPTGTATIHYSPTISFREFLGRDDENSKIYFSPLSGNPLTVAGGVTAQAKTPPEWFGNDASGLYRLLWDMEKIDLSLLNNIGQPSEVGQQDHRGCFWCGKDGSNNTYGSCPVEVTGAAVQLPYPEACTTANPLYSTNLRDCWCVKDNVDKAKTTPHIMHENNCPDNVSLVNFSWKKGTTLYCSNRPPYNECAGKNCDPACADTYLGCPSACTDQYCGVDQAGNLVANQGMWREDLLDSLRYDKLNGLDAFIKESKSILEAMSGENNFGNFGPMNNFDEIMTYLSFCVGGQFNGFYKWIKVKNTTQGDLIDASTYQASDLNELGGLQRLMIMIETIKNEIETKKNASFAAQGGGVCSANTNASSLEGCLNDTLAAIDACTSACNTQNCNAIAGTLGLPFDTATPPYDTQTTDCTDPAQASTDYVFLKELANWRAKLFARKAYLFGPVGGAGIYAQMQLAIDKLEAARQAIKTFLLHDSVAKMRAIMNPIAQAKDTVVYAWRDEAKPGQPADSGKWHIVRAKMNLPTLCNGKCGRTSCEFNNDRCEDETRSRENYPNESHACQEPYMPKVRKWYHDINSRTFWSVVDYESPSDDRKGCCGKHNKNDVGETSSYYNLESYKDARKCFKGGLVRASLMRYDESGGALNWATGINFWKMKFDNPKAPGSSQAGYSPNDIEAKCGTIMSYGQEFHPGMAESPDDGCSYGVDGAFVLNCYSQMNEECYWVVNDLIKRYGTATDSCAEYFCKGEDETVYDQTKFGIKFVPCPNRNWDPAQ